MPCREFLGRTAATLTAMAAAPSIVRAQGGGARKGRLGVGFIGCGGRSGSHFQMVKAGHLSDKTIRFDTAKREMAV